MNALQQSFKRVYKTKTTKRCSCDAYLEIVALQIPGNSNQNLGFYAQCPCCRSAGDIERMPSKAIKSFMTELEEDAPGLREFLASQDLPEVDVAEFLANTTGRF